MEPERDTDRVFNREIIPATNVTVEQEREAEYNHRTEQSRISREEPKDRDVSAVVVVMPSLGK